MNRKFLFAATIAVALLSTVAMADEAPAAAAATPLTRAQVSAELARATANGSLQRTDYDADARTFAQPSTVSQAQVSADMVAATQSRKDLMGPDRNGSYNPFGAQVNARSTLARAAVKVDVRKAAANGTLQATDYDDAALVARRVAAHAASVGTAQRIKAFIANV